MKRSACKTCGRAIIWVSAPSTDGKSLVKVPLDAIAPTYRVLDADSEPAVAARADDVFVSHFATCPQASEHSRCVVQR